MLRMLFQSVIRNHPRRVKSAGEMVNRMQGQEKRSECVASTIAFTHWGVVENLDFTNPIQLMDIAGMANIIAEAAAERVEETQFTSFEPLGEGKLKQALMGIHSAWFASIGTRRGEGHMLGIVPGRFAGEYIAWDASLELPVLKPYKINTLLREIGDKFVHGIYAGSVFSFRGK